LQLANRYKVDYFINAGGFARTFAATDELRLNRPCIIKQFSPAQQDPETLRKTLILFRQEALILGNLGHHPQIPSLSAFFKQEKQLYIVQEFFEGQDLFKQVAQGGVFDEFQIRKILLDLSSILQFVHNRKVIHRDIKPSNIIGQSNGSFALIDFGSSLRLNHPIYANSGTPGYAPVEQMRGHVTPSSDLYSLGITCIRLLTGLLPNDDASDPLFDGSGALVNWEKNCVNIAPELVKILDKLVEPDLTLRCQSAAALCKMLHRGSIQKDFTLPPLNPLPGSTQSTTNLAQFDISISSDVGADYRKLIGYLSNQNYEAADQETWNLILQITGREEKDSLNIASIEQFPLMDLDTLDQLWQTFSNKRFGFRVQKRIFENLGGKITFNYPAWQSFGEHVGWYYENHWREYSQLQFSLASPEGHLPACFSSALTHRGRNTSTAGYGWQRLGFAFLMKRIDALDVLYYRSRSQNKRFRTIETLPNTFLPTQLAEMR
jgi:serine/threonine protein kinase